MQRFWLLLVYSSFAAAQFWYGLAWTFNRFKNLVVKDVFNAIQEVFVRIFEGLVDLFTEVGWQFEHLCLWFSSFAYPQPSRQFFPAVYSWQARASDL